MCNDSAFEPAFASEHEVHLQAPMAIGWKATAVKAALRIAASGVIALMAGCANFGAVSQYAHETSRVAGAVRSEFAELDALCREQAELIIVINDIADDGPLQACDDYKASQGRLAALTLDLLDDTARALAGLADDRSFDLTTDVNAVGKRIAAVREPQGATVVSRGEAVALTQIGQVLTEIATEGARDRAVRRLAAEAPNLATAGRVLRSFFVADATAPPGRSTAPYANIVLLTRESFDSTQKQLRQARFRQAEPLRTMELLRGMRVRDAELRRRTGNAPDAVPVVIVDAIDAWLEATTAFAQEALQGDRAELMRRIKVLRTKTDAARNAFQKDYR